MKYKIKNDSDFEKTLEIQIDVSDLADFREGAIKKIGSQLKVKGFRPGKIPANIVEREVGEEYINEEAVEMYLPENLFSILKVLGVVGLALIVLEAALDLKLIKEKAGLIFKSLSTAVLGLFATSYVGALVVNYAFSMPMIEALLFTVPLSILSSAIILPSLGLSLIHI